MDNVKYPEINLDIDDFSADGNAFALMGKVTRALRRNGVSPEEVEAFRKEATSGGYDELLATCFGWINIA